MWGDLGILLEMLEGSIVLPFLLELRARLEHFGGMAVVKDEVLWSIDSEKGYTVSSCYAHFASFCLLFWPPNRCDVSLGIAILSVSFAIFSWKIRIILFSIVL